jgi:hypothetical protein
VNVLICAARGARLTEPPRALPDVPPRPEHDGGENPGPPGREGLDEVTAA